MVELPGISLVYPLWRGSHGMVAGESNGLPSACEPWCAETCAALNGEDLRAECGGCTREWACSPGAPGYSSQTSVDAPSHFSRAGSELVRLQPWEQELDTAKRHQHCNEHGVEVLDADDHRLDERIKALLDGAQAPMLVTGLLGAWPAPHKWTKGSLGARGGARVIGVRPWTFGEAAGTMFGEQVQNATIAGYLDRWNEQHIRAGGDTDSGVAATVFSEPNGVVFQNKHCNETEAAEAEGSAYDHTVEALLEPVPTPRRLELLIGLCEAKHYSLSAYGVSHGFHRHEAVWHGLAVGRKAWYVLPRFVHQNVSRAAMEDPDLDPSASVFGFPHDETIKKTNSMCGWNPLREADPQVHDKLRTCLQHAGEVLLLPANWWHATCTLTALAFGRGETYHTASNAMPVSISMGT